MKRRKSCFKVIILAIVLGFLITSCNSIAIAKMDSKCIQSKLHANTSWFWSNYEVLSDTSTDVSYSPEIAIDSNDNIHVVWQDSTDILGSGADTDIFYKYFDIITETWSSVEIISTESTEISSTPTIAVDTNGDVHVAWLDWTDYLGADTDRDVFYKKKNAGGSWTVTSVVSTESTINIYNSLSIDTDNSDNVYVSWTDPTDIGGSGSDYDVFLKYFNNTASIWSSLILISTESSASSYDAELAVDSSSGDVHLVWEDWTDILGAGTDGDIFYRRWNVFSSTLSDLEYVNSFSTLNAYDPELVLDQNNDLHVVWGDYTPYLDSGINMDIFYKKLDTTLGTWHFPEIVSSESINSAIHSNILADKVGTVFVTWYDPTDYAGAGIDNDIFFKFKDSSTNQWSLSDVVSIESGELSHESELAIDSSGFISCVWSDDSNLGGSGTDSDIYYRKFAGIPSSPILFPILPNPSTPGNVSLNWNQIHSADEYIVYRSNSYIWSISNLDPLITTTNEYYIDSVNETETYFYAVIAQNEYGNSVLSNVELVEIVEESRSGLFAYLGLTEILILVGAVVGLQIIGSAITYALVKSSVQTKKKTTKRKK